MHATRRGSADLHGLWHREPQPLMGSSEPLRVLPSGSVTDVEAQVPFLTSFQPCGSKSTFEVPAHEFEPSAAQSLAPALAMPKHFSWSAVAVAGAAWLGAATGVRAEGQGSSEGCSGNSLDGRRHQGNLPNEDWTPGRPVNRSSTWSETAGFRPRC